MESLIRHSSFQIPYDFTNMWNLKSKIINKQNYNRLIDIENRLTVARWEGLGGMGGEDEGIRK